MKLILENVKKSFGDKTVIDDTGYVFESGKIYGLLGVNGSGKTTLFRLIYDDLKKDDGEFSIEEENTIRKSEHEDIGMIFSEPLVPEFLTGYEFLKFYLEINPSEENISIDEYFKMFNFKEEDMHKLIKTYSHGMKSKLNIICLFIRNPKILLLDEPLASIDVVVSQEIKDILMRIKKDHIIILSTHIMELAKGLCDEIVLLKDGKLIGLPELQKNNPNYEHEIIELLSENKEE